MEAAIQERRHQLEEERTKDREEHLKLLDLEAEKQAIIQEERERLLREHAELADFLPKNTLQNEREHQIVQNARQEHTCSTQIAPLTTLCRTLRASSTREPCQANN